MGKAENLSRWKKTPWRFLKRKKNVWLFLFWVVRFSLFRIFCKSLFIQVVHITRTSMYYRIQMQTEIKSDLLKLILKQQKTNKSDLTKSKTYRKVTNIFFLHIFIAVHWGKNPSVAQKPHRIFLPLNFKRKDQQIFISVWFEIINQQIETLARLLVSSIAFGLFQLMNANCELMKSIETTEEKKGKIS